MNDFESIYKTYFSDVYKYARSLTLDSQYAEEITEETFFRALKNLDSFRGDCKINIWLCHIAKNIFFDEQKKRSRFTDGEEALDGLPDENDFTNTICEKETALSIHRLLHKMDEPYKEVFSLRVFGELSFDDIGMLFSKSAHWACVTYHRAKEKIQKELKQNE